MQFHQFPIPYDIYCYEAFELLPGVTTLFRDLQEAYPWCL